MNNSVFEKTMENIHKHRNIKLIASLEDYLKVVMKPNFKSGVRFDETQWGARWGKQK